MSPVERPARSVAANAFLEPIRACWNVEEITFERAATVVPRERSGTIMDRSSLGVDVGNGSGDALRA